MTSLDIFHEDSQKTAPPGRIPFRTESCSSHHFLYDCYAYWCNKIKEPPRYHRKQWEFIYIIQSLWERGLLEKGKSGIGFGVGQEPLSALFASLGCNILGTDQSFEQAQDTGWIETKEHADNIALLNDRDICPSQVFQEQVLFRSADMNEIPSDIRGYDFCWSACCFEHLGNIEKGIEFFINSIDTLKPGGYAIHTTEYNLSSNTHTVDNNPTVIYRKKDIEHLIYRLENAGHKVEPLLIHTGSQPIDEHIDAPPYSNDKHLRLRLAEHDTTSIGIIAQKRR